jgi:hypothetical protein
MIAKLLDRLFGCWHSRYSFPITARRAADRNGAAMRVGTYVVCLDCGKEFRYDWHQMRILYSSREHRDRLRDLAAKPAA